MFDSTSNYTRRKRHLSLITGHKMVHLRRHQTAVGEHARNFLGAWNGKLVSDDFYAYKASFEKGMVESPAWPTPATSFSICTWQIKVNLRNRHCTRLATCTN